jgi:hypothetical protein
VYYILLFVYGVYSAVIQNRAFSEKYASVAFYLGFRKLIARGFVKRDSVSREARVNYYERQRNEGKRGKQRLLIRFLVNQNFVKDREQYKKAGEEVGE